jgi:hypothetical protein
MPSFGKDVKQEEFFYTVDESINWTITFERNLAICREIKEPKPCDPAGSVLGMCPLVWIGAIYKTVHSSIV